MHGKWKTGLLGMLILVLVPGLLWADFSVENAEEEGIDLPTEPAVDRARTQVLTFSGDTFLGDTDILLVPESTNDTVMGFDPMTGDFIANVIPSDSVNLATPICAILSPTGDSLLVSDQVADVVQEYDLAGNYIGIYAPAGGVDNSIVDNMRGIDLRDNGNLLITIGSGANADAIAEFDTMGNYVGNFIAIGDSGVDSPFDVLVDAEVLVGSIDSDVIQRFDLTGTYIADFTAINTFPEQLNFAANGNLLVANFSGAEEGINEYLPDGTFVGRYDPASLGGYRGVYELGNGNLLVTNGGGVHEIDRMGNLVETKMSGVSARFIELLSVDDGSAIFSDGFESGDTSAWSGGS